jgi:hypothetical protein
MSFTAGCATSKTSNTARTATEQLLISNAVDESLANIDFGSFAGHKVFVEEKYMDSVDKPYIVGSVRHKLMMQGVRVVDKKENSDVTIELRSGGVGTDSSEMFVGIPEIVVPGMVTIPEMRVMNRDKQQGTAKIGMVAYHTESGQVLGNGGVSLSQSERNNWYVFGVGPYRNGSIEAEIKESQAVSMQTPDVEIPRQVAFQPARYAPAPYVRTEPSGKVRLTSEEDEQQ